MKVFRYWANSANAPQRSGVEPASGCYAGSDVSQEDALRLAVERSQKVSVAISRGVKTSHYPNSYSDRMLREEVVQEIHHEQQRVAAITRNAAGSLVLNTTNALFADIDYQSASAEKSKNLFQMIASSSSIKDFFAQLLGSHSTQRHEQQDQKIIARTQSIIDRVPGLGLRLYRTAHGFRGLITSDVYDPLAEKTIQLLQILGSDPLYVKLCKAQECFRARLSPKHWRCGIERPPSRFPWENAEIERKYRAWENSYHQAADTFSTCAFIESFGNQNIHPAIVSVLEVHDRMSCKEGATLA